MKYQSVCHFNLHQKHGQMFGRTLKLSIAKDNGRCVEFEKKREYPDKQRCYECGKDGHLSYQCPENVLGHREPPPKKNNKKHRRGDIANPIINTPNHDEYKYNDVVNMFDSYNFTP